MLQVKVNSNYSFEIDKNEDGLLINGRPVAVDIRQLNASAHHIINSLKSYKKEAPKRTAKTRSERNSLGFTHNPEETQFQVTISTTQ